MRRCFIIGQKEAAIRIARELLRRRLKERSARIDGLRATITKGVYSFA